MSPVAEAPLLRLEHVSKTFVVKPLLGEMKRIEALRGVSLTLQAGRALAIVGESGSGKSTLGGVVTRLFQPSGGRVLFRGRDISGFNDRAGRMAFARCVQMVFQDPFAALNPVHTVRHHLARPLTLHRQGSETEAALRDILKQVELDPETTAHKYPHELSGGQRQRVNLARALAVGAELIVADEPTSMLDVSIRRSALDLMRRLKEEHGIGFLYITHDIATARYLAEETAVMFAGQIVEWGPSEAIVGNARHPYTRLLLSAVPDASIRIEAAGGEGGRAFAAMAERVRAFSRRPAGVATEVGAGHFVRHQSDEDKAWWDEAGRD